MKRSQFLRIAGVSLCQPALDASAAAPEPGEKPELRIGIIADCQYADCDNSPDGKRLYRKSIQKLEAAVGKFNDMGDLDFVVHLGDMIDRDFPSYQAVMPIYNKLKATRYQVLGNHDFSVKDEEKARVPTALGMEKTYYSWTKGKWRFAVLDGSDLSTYGHAAGSEKRLAAEAFLKASKKPLADYNGGLGTAQIAWLREQLTAARDAGQQVILFCHYPIQPPSSLNLWNAAEVTDLLTSFHDVVRLWGNGHDHDGNYAAQGGIHFLNFRGMVDTENNALGVLEIYPDKIRVTGHDREPNRTLPFPAPDCPPERTEAKK